MTTRLHLLRTFRFLRAIPFGAAQSATRIGHPTTAGQSRNDELHARRRRKPARLPGASASPRTNRDWPGGRWKSPLNIFETFLKRFPQKPSLHSDDDVLHARRSRIAQRNKRTRQRTESPK